MKPPGSGTARATATTTFDASQYLTAEVPVFRVEVRFSASGSGVLKAPWDRSVRIWVDALSAGEFSEGEVLHTFEGYCDFFEKGGLQLDSLSVVITPLPDYDIVDGRPVI